MAGARDGRARYPDVRLVLFPFRIEQDWPNLGTRFRRLMERLSFARHSLAALLAGGYDAVIVNKPFDFPILSRARARGLRAVTLFRSGGTDFFAGDRLFANAIDVWASSSRYNADQVHARYGRAVEVIHNGVDAGRFAPPTSQTTVAPGSLALVSVGRLVGWKGHRVVIEALRGLPGSIHYRIVGEGPERAALEARARELGVANRVRFEGRVGHDALPALLGECDLFVQPSIGEEAFGISVVEAMACGLPALVSDQGGLREIVDDESCGLRLPAGRVDAWCAAIEALARDGARRERMARAARERVVEAFTWAANAARHESLLSRRLAA
jgi:glycosyltransferase involved in cell wall biosynthesis